ncbi:MAG: HAMP domain-containing histidine kinase [Oscillospiraceae bacterium]|nr:HAMP domain-containing histidine kinase [Oscillospiraceae bacterium]
MKSKGIRRRWMANSISVVVLVVLLAVTAFSTAMASYYYNYIQNGLASQANVTARAYRDFQTESEYYQNAKRYAEQLRMEEKDANKMELQFIDSAGAVRFSTSGLTPPFSTPGTPDIEAALQSDPPAQGEFVGNDPSTGERIMAISCPLIVDGRAVAAIRVITSLRLVDRQIILVVGLTALVGLAILAMVYFSNLFFVRSIVEPVVGITETAKRIAAGSYGIQIEKKYDDEVGDLTDAINNMSLQIKQTEKLKNEFISSVSHELRTPLTAINGWAETIMNGEVRNATDVKKGMGIIVSEARRLTNMVEELLEFSRIQDGRFTLAVEPIDIKAELEDAVYTYKEFFRREGIELQHTDCEEEFPPISGDPERLRQVFCNLLDNAAKHGGSGHRIDTAIWREEADIVIVIRDYGPGIPEEELPHVKYKFYKGSSKARGSGIGLAVCDEIVSRHNGRLDIGNAEGGGCIVTVRLPMDT